MVEQEAVNFKVRGSNPRGGATKRSRAKSSAFFVLFTDDELPVDESQ